MLKAGRRVLAVALACAATQAAALDVDQIEIRSQMGQPLLAEIPIVSSDPAELRNLQAQLATAVTFARVGLERPHGAVAALQFAIARDARGKPVIRVTTAAPVTEDFFTFIVELDWGNGHLVRQYSVALDNPNTLTAALPPPIQAPVAGPSNLIERAAPVAIPLAGDRAAAAPVVETPPIPLAGAAPSRPVAVQSNAAMPPPAASVPPTRPQPKPTPSSAPKTAPTPKPVAVAPKPVPAKPAPPSPTPKPQPATPPAAPPPAARSPLASTSTAAYTVKPGDNLAAIAAREGRSGVSRDQTMIALLRANPDAFIGGNINRIRQGASLQVPDAAETGRVSAAEAALMVRQQVAQWRNGGTPVTQPAALAGNDKAMSTAATAQASAKPAAPPPGARLEIVPAAANAGGKAGMRSGVEAGGVGDTLRKELDEKRETLAARDVELKELRRRVAGLEKIQQDQQKLIAMQGSALAAAQRTAGAIGKQNDTTAPASTPDRAPVWPWALAAVIVLGLLGWLVARSRRATPVVRSAFDAESLAAAVPREEPAAVAADNAIRAGEPTWHARSAHEEASDAAVAGLDPHSAGYKKIRLAQAHIDLGDADAARPILRDVVEADDDAAGTVALRLLYNLDHPARA